MKLRSVLTTVAVLAFAAASPALAEKGNSNGGGNGNGNGNGNTHSNAADHTTSVSAKSNSSGSAKHTTSASAQTTSSTPSKKGLASELKGLNAVKANPNALEHASPNSQVGRIALYRDAALATAEQQILLDEAIAAKALLPVPRDPLLIQGDIDTAQGAINDINIQIGLLDPLDPLNTPALDQLNADLIVAEGDKTGFVQEQLDAAPLQQALDDAQLAIDEAAANQAAAQGLEDGALLTASNGRTLSDEAIAYIRSVLGL